METIFEALEAVEQALGSMDLDSMSGPEAAAAALELAELAEMCAAARARLEAAGDPSDGRTDR